MTNGMAFCVCALVLATPGMSFSFRSGMQGIGNGLNGHGHTITGVDIWAVS